LLACIEAAIAAANSDAVDAAARGCVDLLRSEATRYHDDYLKLCLLALTEALRAPEAVRAEEIHAALVMCRRTIVQGVP
jgi:hypothetical protein